MSKDRNVLQVFKWYICAVVACTIIVAVHSIVEQRFNKDTTKTLEERVKYLEENAVILHKVNEDGS